MTETAHGRFPATSWSIVVAAGGGTDSRAVREALASLCEIYWYPLYAYARRRGKNSADAEDLTQGFLARLIEKGSVGHPVRERGKFRSYLLGAFNHYLANERDRQRAAKRGGRATLVPLPDAEERYRSEPREKWTPEQIFQRRWALTVLETVLDRLQREYAGAGKGALFQELKGFLTGERERGAYTETADRLKVSETAVRVAAHRLRRRYRARLRAEVTRTVSSPEEVEAELRFLLQAVSG